MILEFPVRFKHKKTRAVIRWNFAIILFFKIINYLKTIN
ncbi:MAG: hypothetical protein CH6_0497 [Candidatus Kapaibacterium sp.]|nr:MAG: hypothetical protein CH6_0497 [Candidatus Kapabacteria bacterium]